MAFWIARSRWEFNFRPLKRNEIVRSSTAGHCKRWERKIHAEKSFHSANSTEKSTNIVKMRLEIFRSNDIKVSLLLKSLKRFLSRKCDWGGCFWIMEEKNGNEIKVSHFLVSFWAAWWASRPSDKLFSVVHSISSVFCRPPNHFTQTQSLGVGSPSGPLTIFPGQASQPRVAPQIKSPIIKFDWATEAELVEGRGEVRESSDSIKSVAIGLIVFTGGESFNKSKSLFPSFSSSFGESSLSENCLSDDADSAICLFGVSLSYQN